MTARAQNLTLVAALIIALVLVAYALRKDDGSTSAASASPSPSLSLSSSASPSPSASASPSESPSESASSSASPSPTQLVIKKAAFIGDSVAAGAGASTPSKRWTTLLSTANGWTETNVAHAQTGYLRAGSKAPCTADSCPNFATAATAAFLRR